MQLNKIPGNVLKACRERGHTDEAIKLLTPQEAFSEFCEWEGLVGWAATLWETVRKLNESVK